ncbi:MAG: transposase [bacterium]
MGCPTATKRRRVRKRVDSRDWRKYNAWQKDEVLLALQWLRSLVDRSTIHDWERANGRPRIARRTIVLCLLIKSYFHVSYRRLTGLLVLLAPVLGLAKVPHYNTLANYGRDASLTPTLKRLFNETAKPFWLTEKIVTLDSSGLLLHGSGAWRSDHDPEARRDYGKIHVLSGTKRRATLAVALTRGTWHDSTQVDPVLDEKPSYAVAQALTGDGAYWTHRACASAKAHGLQPYFKPHDNARWWPHPADEFERMTRYAHQFPNRFGKVYHRRSTSESRFATEKGLFGDRLRSRRPEARRNEVYCREVVHNARITTWIQFAE